MYLEWLLCLHSKAGKGHKSAELKIKINKTVHVTLPPFLVDNHKISARSPNFSGLANNIRTVKTHGNQSSQKLGVKSELIRESPLAYLRWIF